MRTVNEYDSPEEIADLVISMADGPTVRVGDVAEVVRGTRERDEITRTNGQESVELAIYREGDANTVTVARDLHARLDEWRAGKLPPGTELNVLFDQSVFIAKAGTCISSVARGAMISAPSSCPSRFPPSPIWRPRPPGPIGPPSSRRRSGFGPRDISTGGRRFGRRGRARGRSPRGGPGRMRIARIFAVRSVPV